MWHDQPETWISILAQMEELETIAVVPGHGPLGTREDLILLRNYLIWMLETTAEVIKRGGSAEDVLKESLPEPYASWKGLDGGEQIAHAIHQLLSSRAEK